MYFMKNRLEIVLLGATFASLSFIGVTNAAIVNGSFESPAMATDSWHVLATDDSTITGWTVETPVDGAGIHINGHGPGGTATVLGPQDGSQFVELDGGNVSGYGPVYIEQTISGLNIGAQYNLVGYYGWSHRAGDENGKFKVTLVGVGDLLGLTLADNDQQWTQFNLPFTASSTSHTIRFSSLGTNWGQHVALDNIAVVPEPASAGLAALGLSLFGLRRRRK